jgi:predicted amidohydrolase YtcJ
MYFSFSNNNLTVKTKDMKKSVFLLMSATILLAACNSHKAKVDLIVTNAKVYTVNNKFALAESFAILEGKFVAVGSNKEITGNYTADEVLDLQGLPVFPGFYDAHCHFLGYGKGLMGVDLVGTKSIDEIIERVKAYASNTNQEWIVGRGWDQNDWDVKELPDNEKLSQAFPNRPVVLKRVDGHALLANHEALNRAGIKLNTTINGGKFIKKGGKLTGVLVDNGMSLVYNAIPSATELEKEEALLLAQKNCFAVGLTSVADAGLPYDDIIRIRKLQESGKLKIRIHAMLSPTKDNLENFVKKGPVKTEKLSISCIKLFADGALGSRGALLLGPYSDDPENYGLLVDNIQFMKEICQMAYQYNFQVATHAIGDSANRLMLSIYSEFLKEANDRRWRIEHAQIVNEKDFGLFRKYSIIPSVQPTHATSDMYWAGKRLGNERLKNAYAYKTLLAQNGWFPSGSDFPVEDINPLFGFYAAVARMDQEYFPEGGFQAEEAVSKEDALRSITIWAAKSSFEENEKGSIEAGKFADFVVLEKNIMEIDIKETYAVKVKYTFVGGEKVND